MERRSAVAAAVIALCWLAAAPAAAQQYPDEDRNGLPVAERVVLGSLRAGLDIGAGWFGAGAAEAAGLRAPALTIGFGIDHLRGSHLAFGLRLGYLSAGGDAPGESFSAFEAGARVRVGVVPWLESESRQLELEAGLGVRIASPGAHHATASLGAMVSLDLMRVGVRYTRALSADAAFGDAVLGVAEWMTPTVIRHGGWPARERKWTTRIGLGLHVVGGGFALRGLGPVLPGLAAELPVFFGGPPVVAVLRWDLLWMPLGDGDDVLADTVLLGAQWYEVAESRFGVSAALGYTVGHGAATGVAADGLVVDAAILYSLASMGGLFLDVHTRVGLEGRSEDVRAVFLSVGGRQIFR